MAVTMIYIYLCGGNDDLFFDGENNRFLLSFWIHKVIKLILRLSSVFF